MDAYPLVSKRVDVDGASYHIHGLVHGNPLISISKEFKGEVNERLKGCHTICEDGFAEWIENAISFNEAKYFGFDKLSFPQYLASFRNFVYNKFILKPHKTEFMKQVREMKTIEEFYSVREELFKGYLPEPEGMNKLIARHNCGTLDNPARQFPLRIRRYMYEARRSLDHAHKNGLNELHIVVGCAHELPLEYLLKNQNLLNSGAIAENRKI